MNGFSGGGIRGGGDGGPDRVFCGMGGGTAHEGQMAFAWGMRGGHFGHFGL